VREEYHFYSPCPRFMEDLAAAELTDLGAVDVDPGKGGTAYTGTLETGYRVCLWSRLVSRVYLEVKTVPAETGEDLFQGAFSIPWPDHMPRGITFRVDATGTLPGVINSMYGAQVVKDAVTDTFRRKYGFRPQVDLRRPGFRIGLHMGGGKAFFGVDLSGISLHRRGYRERTGEAPLKENTASAVLLRADWPGIYRTGGGLLDPFCGSGTIPIEAALMAGGIPPGLLMRQFGFENWLGHRRELWNRLILEAEERKRKGLSELQKVSGGRILGSDRDPKVIDSARENAREAELDTVIEFRQQDVSKISPPGELHKGLLVTNPPYGERLGDKREAEEVFRTLGGTLKNRFPGWDAAVLSSDSEAARKIGMSADRINTVYNGPIRCSLYRFSIWDPDASTKSKPEEKVPVKIKREGKAYGSFYEEANRGIGMFRNRLEKNIKHIGKWARRNEVTCYRLYDSDVPEYAISIDAYENTWIVVNEYRPPKTVPEIKAKARLDAVMNVIPEVLEVDRKNVFLKRRQRRKQREQYDKLADKGKEAVIHEGGNKFYVNFTDYIDTGIFLDHRITRGMIGDAACGMRFLNLFSYTATATVYAASGGALFTVSVDNSNTYTDWGKRNMELNGHAGGNHAFIKEDCVSWLEGSTETFDLIFLDPPTFSNEKKRNLLFDVQRDHVKIIKLAMKRLSPEGMLFFSTNFKKFKIDRKGLADFSLANITARTIPEDFKRKDRISELPVHFCYMIQYST